jgi:hypothetical protein
LIQPNIKIYDGYADFCKLIAIKNFTKAKIGSTLITLENFQYLRSGYSSRRESELPVFSRWLELPLDKPQAKWLILVLYSKEQIDNLVYQINAVRKKNKNTWCCCDQMINGKRLGVKFFKTSIQSLRINGVTQDRGHGDQKVLWFKKHIQEALESIFN